MVTDEGFRDAVIVGGRRCKEALTLFYKIIDTGFIRRPIVKAAALCKLGAIVFAPKAE